MAKHNEIGKIGENIARTFLIQRGFTIKNTNERFRFGEIDIVAEKDNLLHFIEVKSVKVKDTYNIKLLRIQPEENLTFWKKFKFKRAINLYLNHNEIKNKKIQIDLVCIYVNEETREGRVKFFENIEL